MVTVYVFPETKEGVVVKCTNLKLTASRVALAGEPMPVAIV